MSLSPTEERLDFVVKNASIERCPVHSSLTLSDTVQQWRIWKNSECHEVFQLGAMTLAKRPKLTIEHCFVQRTSIQVERMGFLQRDAVDIRSEMKDQLQLRSHRYMVFQKDEDPRLEKLGDYVSPVESYMISSAWPALQSMRTFPPSRP